MGKAQDSYVRYIYTVRGLGIDPRSRQWLLFHKLRVFFFLSICGIIELLYLRFSHPFSELSVLILVLNDRYISLLLFNSLMPKGGQSRGISVLVFVPPLGHRKVK